MTINQKVQALEKYTDNSIGFQRYYKGWTVSSFKEKSLFVVNGRAWEKLGGPLEKPTFQEAVDAAYKMMLQDKNDKTKQK